MSSSEPTGALVHDEHGAAYRIDGLERMEPFFTTVVSETDLWMFASSTGALTAGRRNADLALFPYQTDDRLHRAAGRVGPLTIIAHEVDGIRDLWRPFGADVNQGGPRSIAKHVSGNRLVFEEHHPAHDLRWRMTWEPSGRFGWVRTVEVVNESGADVDIEVLDGVVDVMPAGVDSTFEQVRSNLVDAYKRAECGPWGPVAIYNLETLITDRAEPLEALSATVVWSTGFECADVHLDERAIGDMLAGRPSAPTTLVTGRPGAYLRRGTVSISAGEVARWRVVCDIGLGHAEVENVIDLVSRADADALIADDIALGAAGLDELLAAADADQRTADPVADAHHRSNVLFNSMRGGALVDGPYVSLADFASFVHDRNADVFAAHADWFGPTEGVHHIEDLRRAAVELGDTDVLRLVLEYLPLTFSRRHGDPSRPWNRFDIDVRSEDGSPRLAYEGNWRDIFQNWEALLFSAPVYLPSVVAKFVNATSIEGYNAYRLSRDGIEWEVPDPADPWAHIGYWGDHQLVYLLRLVEMWRRFQPSEVGEWLDRSVFASADIPYRLADHAEMIDDPDDTITYDEAHAAAIERRVDRIGADGRLLTDDDGDLVRAGLLEKLLVPALAKLACFVPGGGLWLNTQRPEWNDANNALAGMGLSVVTTFHLRRYLTVIADIVAEARAEGLEHVQITEVVAGWIDDTSQIFGTAPVAPDDAESSRALLDAISTRAATHCGSVRAGVSGETLAVELDEVTGLCRAALAHIDATLAISERDDGLVHSYNVMSLPSSTTVEVEHLSLMLEGQVAALSAGTRTPAEAADLVRRTLDSDLRRRDLDSLLLYPPAAPSAFLSRNVLPADVVERLAALGDAVHAVTDVDPSGQLRFATRIVNAAALGDALDRVGASNDERTLLLDTFEEVFDHRSFTGRSARMYGYEGIGSVYWHMVAKLLLAVQDLGWEAIDRGESDEVVAQIGSLYRELRDGFGFRMSPHRFGAFPTDCYSHSPAHSGAQQPGMTGQVKEEILTRFGELGLRVVDGRVSLEPMVLPPTEVMGSDGAHFSLFGVPMSIERADHDGVEASGSSGDRSFEELSLPADVSAELFVRRGTIDRVAWYIGPDSMQRWEARTSTGD